jgi:hypothetical protein
MRSQRVLFLSIQLTIKDNNMQWRTRTLEVNYRKLRTVFLGSFLYMFIIYIYIYILLCYCTHNHVLYKLCYCTLRNMLRWKCSRLYNYIIVLYNFHTIYNIYFHIYYNFIYIYIIRKYGNYIIRTREHFHLNILRSVQLQLHNST